MHPIRRQRGRERHSRKATLDAVGLLGVGVLPEKRRSRCERTPGRADAHIGLLFNRPPRRAALCSVFRHNMIRTIRFAYNLRLCPGGRFAIVDGEKKQRIENATVMSITWMRHHCAADKSELLGMDAVQIFTKNRPVRTRRCVGPTRGEITVADTRICLFVIRQESNPDWPGIELGVVLRRSR